LQLPFFASRFSRFPPPLMLPQIKTADFFEVAVIGYQA
jgi:hypothetical protein